MSTINHTLSYPEAYAVVRWYCADFQENLPADATLEQFGVGLHYLDLKLSYFLGREVKAHDVLGVVERFIEFAELECGDHKDLIPTANGVIDEGGAVRDRLLKRLDDELHLTVTGAGIDPTLRAVAA